MQMINKSSWPVFSNNIIKLTRKIITSGKVNYWTGSFGKNFEKLFCKIHSRKYSIAVSSGTTALEIAIRSLSLNKGDEVITTARSYYASSICIINNDLKIKFCDIELSSHNLDPISVEKNITSKTKAILVVHLGGIPCDMKSFLRIKKKYNLKLIEDCSQAHGAKFNNKIVGSFGDISIWSFCNDKIISTLGEGGMITTNKIKYFKNIWSLKEIGKDYDKFQKLSKSKKDGFKWLHDNTGTNSRMTEIQASSGIVQINDLSSLVKERNKRAEIYIKVLMKYKNLIIQSQKGNNLNAYYRLYFTITPNTPNKKIRDLIIKDLKKSNVEARVDACPAIYNEKYFRINFDCEETIGGFNNTKIVGENSLSLKVDNTITLKSINKTAKILNKILNKYLI